MPGSADVLAEQIEKAVAEHIDLVPVIARQVARQIGRRVDVDDLASAGREGLLGAARTFDPTRGIPFRRWANLRIRGAIIDALRTQSGIPRSVYAKVRAMQSSNEVREALAEEDAAAPAATPEAADARVRDHLAALATSMALAFLNTATQALEDAQDDRSESPEEQVARAELAARVRDAIRERPEAERRLLERHYFDGLTLEAAGREQGLSKSWASRLHARAVAAIGKRLTDATSDR